MVGGAEHGIRESVREAGERERTGTRGYCLTGIGIDRPRDAMERVAEGCWSILRDVKGAPRRFSPSLPGWFFCPLAETTRRCRVIRASRRGTRVSRGTMNNFLPDEEERTKLSDPRSFPQLNLIYYSRFGAVEMYGCSEGRAREHAGEQHTDEGGGGIVRRVGITNKAVLDNYIVLRNFIH